MIDSLAQARNTSETNGISTSNPAFVAFTAPTPHTEDGCSTAQKKS
jgi:hypothetical protein